MKKLSCYQWKSIASDVLFGQTTQQSSEVSQFSMAPKLQKLLGIVLEMHNVSHGFFIKVCKAGYFPLFTYTRFEKN